MGHYASEMDPDWQPQEQVDGSFDARRESAYGEWLDGADYLSDCDEYGSQRAAFYAGIGWAAREIRRLESAQR